MTTTHFKGLSLHAVFMLIPMIHDHRREEHGRILAELAPGMGHLAPAGAYLSERLVSVVRKTGLVFPVLQAFVWVDCRECG